MFFSRLKNNAWDHLVAHLSDGLLYGSEVTRPRWLTRDRKRPFRPQLNRAPSAKRAHVLERLVAGWTYADIAREMNITVRGMRKHVHQIMRQHGVHSRAALHRALGAAPPPPPPTRWRRAATADAVRCR